MPIILESSALVSTQVSASDLIKRSAKKLGVRGDEVVGQDLTDGFNELNTMLDAFLIDRIYIYQIKQASHTWAANQTSRTIGSGGNFDTTRPVKIEVGTFFRDSDSNDYPVYVTHDREEYDNRPVKSSTSTYPDMLFYDTAFGLGVLYAYPVPSSALTLYLNSWQTVTAFTNYDDPVSLPPGYTDLIVNNLAPRLEAVFRAKCPDSVKVLASQARARIAKVNLPTITSSTDIGMALGQSYRSRDIYNDGQ